MIVSAESRDSSRDEIVIEYPFQQSSLALRGEFFRKVGVRANGAPSLRFHRDDSDPASLTLYEKSVSNIKEVKARDGIVISIVTAGDHLAKEASDHIIELPSAPDLLSPMLEIVPLQLLAYHIAVRRGCDVDQPRNLAKSVTVE